MNLLLDRWLPVMRAGGRREFIAPSGLTADLAGDPVVALDSVRPDFDNALMQFLIGLLQTVMPPDDEYDWCDRYDEPPAPGELEARFQPWVPAFELSGTGPRFLQDVEPLPGAGNAIGALLLECPGGQTVRLNTDHFQKRGMIDGLCERCAAAALVSLQTNAPSGGKGHRTSLRGGGPLTTLVLPSREGKTSLWHVLWANVLPSTAFDGPVPAAPAADILPWLGTTRVSEQGQATTPVDVHPLQSFWGMPRRIRLEGSGEAAGACSLCDQGEIRYTSYVTRPYGTNYVGAWRHPLSPYRRDPDGLPICLHPGPSGLGYRDWPRYVFGDPAGGLPAMVVHAAITSAPRYRRLGQRPRMHVAGFDMDNMKARCWYEVTVPVFALDEDQHPAFAADVQAMADVAGLVAANLTQAVRDAWFDPKGTKKGPDTSFLRRDFLSETEPLFFDEAAAVHDAYLGAGPRDVSMVRWHRELCRAAREQFDRIVGSTNVVHEDPARYARARARLIRVNKSKKIKGLLGIAA